MTEHRLPIVSLIGRRIVSADAYANDHAHPMDLADDEFHRFEIELDDGRTVHVDCWTDMAGGDAGITVSVDGPT